MTELHQQLRESIQELEQIRKVKEHTAQLQIQLAAEEKDLEVMERMLAQEQKDVETLEREGLTSMFRKFLGDREERLEKEREEYLRASLRFNELYKSVELIRFELDLLSKKEQNQETVGRKIETLIAYREEELMRLDPPVAIKLKGINEQTDKLHKYGVEVEEAYKAGMQALELVRHTENNLLEAQKWGQRDMWGGRNPFSGKLKHDALDNARHMASKSQHALIRFGNELRDVYSNLQLRFNMDIEEFRRFTDLFFDNLITDWMVQQKINTSLTNVSATRREVESLIYQLDQERGVIKEKVDALEQERKKMIVEAGS